jgi:hypothetical protein
MKRLLWFAGAVAVAASLVPSVARAQAIGGPAPYVAPSMYNPYRQPIFSPYLGLGLGGVGGIGNRGINYAGFVVPQIQAGVAIQQLEGQGAGVQQQLLALSAARTSGYTGRFVTGHPFGFQTQYAYFQNTPIGNMAGGTGVGGMGTGVGGGYGGGLGGLGGLYGGVGGIGTGVNAGFGNVRTMPSAGGMGTGTNPGGVTPPKK